MNTCDNTPTVQLGRAQIGLSRECWAPVRPPSSPPGS